MTARRRVEEGCLVSGAEGGGVTNKRGKPVKRPEDDGKTEGR
jgi:hypothetical protein